VELDDADDAHDDGRLAVPEIVLVSHMPPDHAKAVAASVFNVLLAESAPAKAAGFLSTGDDAPAFARACDAQLVQGRTVLINGMTALLSQNAVYALRRALVDDLPVFVYWHETAWNMRFLAQRHRHAFREVRLLLEMVRATHWVASEHGRQLVAFLFGTPFEAVRVVRECADLSRFRAAPRPTGGERFVVAGAGLPGKRKGTDLFCLLSERVRTLGDRPAAWRWYAATPGNTELREPGLVTRHVEWMGCRDDFAEQLVEADALCLTSRDDPFPLVALEALASDRPVFCFGSVGTAEVLPREFVCESLDDMAGKLRAYAEDPGRYPPGFFRAIAEDCSAERFLERAFGDHRTPAAAVPGLDEIPDEIELLYDKLRVLKRARGVAAPLPAAVDAETPRAQRDAMRRARSAVRARERSVHDLTFGASLDGFSLRHSVARAIARLTGSRPRARRVVVVGNSPAVLETRLGDRIDGFDEVIRLNNFQTAGYEAHVGRKTTRAFFSWACKPNAALAGLKKHQRLLFMADRFEQRGWMDDRMTRPDGCGLRTADCTPLETVLYYDGLRDLLGLPAGKWPSTGVVAIQWALDTFGEQGEVWIHGFSFYAESGQTLKRYYNIDTPRDEKHDFEAEARYVRSLIERGKLRELSPRAPA
jgi:glycosyltransferase involved in cell wall biosynthesis